MSFLNPSSLRAAASLWPYQWLSTGRVFFEGCGLEGLACLLWCVPFVDVEGCRYGVVYEGISMICFNCGCFGHVKQIVCSRRKMFSLLGRLLLTLWLTMWIMLFQWLQRLIHCHAPTQINCIGTWIIFVL